MIDIENQIKGQIFIDFEESKIPIHLKLTSIDNLEFEIKQTKLFKKTFRALLDLSYPHGYLDNKTYFFRGDDGYLSIVFRNSLSMIQLAIKNENIRINIPSYKDQITSLEEQLKKYKDAEEKRTKLMKKWNLQ
jgi:hypothetical protein